MTYPSNHEAVEHGQLKGFVSRIERLESEKEALASDIKEIYAEAKGNGFDATILRKIVSLRKKDPEKRRHEETVMSLYLDALGMTPLEEYLEGR